MANASPEPTRESAPPAGEPWDAPFASAPFAFVDLEMTGLGPDDRVIEVCIERVEGGRTVGAVSSLVRPSDGRFGNAHVHGITEEDLASAPVFDALADEIARLLEGAVFVAHGARYDIAFLRSEMARLGRVFDVPYFIDTLVLSRRAFGFKSHTLSALARELSIDPGRSHRAGDDVRVLRALFERVSGVIRPTTPRDLFHVRVGERMARPVVLECARAAAKTGTPVKVRYRRSGKGSEEMVLVVTRVADDAPDEAAAEANRQGKARTRLDPPVVFGYLLPGRGRRELRADRILSIEPVSTEPQKRA